MLSAVSKFDVVPRLTEEAEKFVERLLKSLNVLIPLSSKYLLLLPIKVVPLLFQGEKNCNEREGGK